MAAHHEPHDGAESEESYFISMTDLMIGLLFIFIILLMYFAMQFRETTQNLTSAQDARTLLLRDLEARLQERSVRVTIDETNGVLRLPDEILFPRGSDTLSDAGKKAVGELAQSLDVVLPCYVRDPQKPQPRNCPKGKYSVEAIFIEGHTDNVPLAGTGRLRDNWDLSAARATSTYRAMLDGRPQLGRYTNDAQEGSHVSIFSVAGYADQRPVDASGTELAKAKNRRIDVRIVMTSPRPIANQLPQEK